jgi:hypothetical protein
MKRPSFEYPVCEHCGSFVDKLHVSRLESGDYQIIVWCHDRRTSMTLTQDDIDEHGGEPLVKLRAFKPA